MRCPRCGEDRSSVIDSRPDGEAIRRRRECPACQYRFTTYERVELVLPVVEKKDGRLEPFDRAKIKTGILRACKKRPVSAVQIDRIVDEVELKTHQLNVSQVASHVIGQMVSDALKELDKVAYVRFASVYREFSEVQQFVEALKGLEPEGK